MRTNELNEDNKRTSINNAKQVDLRMLLLLPSISMRIKTNCNSFLKIVLLADLHGAIIIPIL
jgi:hypothetical protein